MKKRNIMLLMLPAYAIVLGLCLLIGIAGSKAITAISDSAVFADRHTLIIDAGHGGEDGGATSCTGILESEYNLNIALRLDALMNLLGVQTKMVRTTDISVYTSGNTISQKKISDLKERVRLVNSTDKALLISIHQNYFSQSQYSGAQVFYSDNAISKEFARNTQSLLISSLNPGSNRTAKKASGIYLMQKVTCPAILVECGFISNPNETSLLGSSDYQKKLCCVLASAVMTQLESMQSLS